MILGKKWTNVYLISQFAICLVPDPSAQFYKKGIFAKLAGQNKRKSEAHN